MFMNKVTLKFILTVYFYALNCAIQTQSVKANQVSYSDKYGSMFMKSKTPAFKLKRDADRNEKEGYASIQYAPLFLNSEDQSLYEKNKVDTKYTVPGFNLNTFKTKNTNLEPHLEDCKKDQDQTKDVFVYGHNIQIPQLKNGNAPYNVVYKNNIELTTKENLNQVNYINPYQYYHKDEYQTEEINGVELNDVEISNREFLTSPPRAEPIYALMAKNYNNEKELYKNERVLSEKESPLIQPQLVYAKPYRLHLNVARAFNVVNTSNIKAKMINKKPSPSQALLLKPETTHLLKTPDKRTKLYSIPNKYLNHVP